MAADVRLDILRQDWDLCATRIATYDSIMFNIKGFAISLVLALSAVSFETSNAGFIMAAMIGCLPFYLLDARYRGLQLIFTERCRLLEGCLSRYLATQQPPAFDGPLLTMISDRFGDPVLRRHNFYRSLKATSVFPIYGVLLCGCLVLFLVHPAR